MASLIWGAGGGPPAYATVRLNRDGTVEVLTGAQDLGTGARTVLAQIAAEVLGAKIGDVRTVLGDTERLAVRVELVGVDHDGVASVPRCASRPRKRATRCSRPPPA